MLNEEIVYNVIVDPAASDRMGEHFDFLAQVNKDAAYKYLKLMVDDINSLQKKPFRNPVYDRPYVAPLKYRYMISNKRYRIVYYVVDNFVYVDDIQDCRQDDDKDLLNL